MSSIKNTAKLILSSGLPVPAIVRPVIRGFYHAGVVMTETLIFVRKILWVEPVLRSICENVGKGLRADRLPYVRGTGRIRLGDNVNLSGRSCFYFMSGAAETPEITIGNNVFVGNGCTFSAGRKIVIGDDVLISAQVRIHDNDGHPTDAEKRRVGGRIPPEDVYPVRIEDGVWIGAQVIILKGVTVGRNAIIGAGAVVTRDVPPAGVAAGNPANVTVRTDGN